MTKGEVKVVRQAIEDLMADEPEFTRAIGSLCKLIGWKYPAATARTTPIDLHGFLATPPQKPEGGSDHE